MQNKKQLKIYLAMNTLAMKNTLVLIFGLILKYFLFFPFFNCIMTMISTIRIHFWLPSLWQFDSAISKLAK
jgi:hypothetical protein